MVCVYLCPSAWVGLHFHSSTNTSPDLIAYSGYKFVGVIVTIAAAALTKSLTTSPSAASAARYSGGYGYVGWAVFGYTFMANAFFLVSSFSKLSFTLMGWRHSTAHRGSLKYDLLVMSSSRRCCRMFVKASKYFTASAVAAYRLSAVHSSTAQSFR